MVQEIFNFNKTQIHLSGNKIYKKMNYTKTVLKVSLLWNKEYNCIHHGLLSLIKQKNVPYWFLKGLFFIDCIYMGEEGVQTIFTVLTVLQEYFSF